MIARANGARWGVEAMVSGAHARGVPAGELPGDDAAEIVTGEVEGLGPQLAGDGEHVAHRLGERVALDALAGALRRRRPADPGPRRGSRPRREPRVGRAEARRGLWEAVEQDHEGRTLGTRLQPGEAHVAGVQ